MKLFYFLLFNLCFVGIAHSQDYTVRGFIRDKSNSEVVGFQKLRLLKSADSSFVTGAVTDVDGYFSFPKLNKGSYILKADNSAYKSFIQNISLLF